MRRISPGIAALVCGLGLVVSPAVADPPPPFSVQPILFIPDPNSFPAGYQPTEAEIQEDLQNITEAMQFIRGWYAEALGLETSLNVMPVIRMDAWGGLADYNIYWNNPTRRYQDGISADIWGPVLTEVGNRGYTAGTSTEPRLNVIFCKGAGGWAGGAQWHHTPGGGNCILGDWCLDAIAERIPPEHYVWWWGDKTDQLGAIAHEMGHCWGLAHPDITTNPVTGVADTEYSVMYTFWNFPNYNANPADPNWPHRGLHAWSSDLGPGGVRYDGYQDVFMNTYRPDWFVTPMWDKGDMNCDGVVDVFDINPFVAALLTPGDYPAEFPDCDINNGDINDDDAIDVFDINPFVDLILQ